MNKALITGSIIVFAVMIVLSITWDQSTQGYMLIAFGNPYIDMAHLLALSIRKYDCKRPIALFTNNIEYCTRTMWNVSDIRFIYIDVESLVKKYHCNERAPSNWDKYGCIPKILAPILAPFPETIFIDCDSLMVSSPENMWRVFQSMPHFITTLGNSDENNRSPNDWFFGRIQQVIEKVQFNVPQCFTTVIFIKPLMVPKAYVDEATHIYNNPDDYAIVRVFKGDSITDEIVYAIIMGKYNIRPSTERIVYISDNHNYTRTQIQIAREQGSPIVTMFHKNIPAMEKALSY